MGATQAKQPAVAVSMKAPIGANSHARVAAPPANDLKYHPRPRPQHRRKRPSRTRAPIGASADAVDRYHVLRSQVAGRATLRGRGGVLITADDDDKGAVWHTFDVVVKQTGHAPSYSFAGKLVQTYVTSTCGPGGRAASVLGVFDSAGVVRVGVRVNASVPRGVLLHLSILDSVINAQGLHGMHVEQASASVDIGQLNTSAPVRVALYDQYGSARKMGMLEVLSATPLPTIESGSVGIVRPSPTEVNRVLGAYIDQFTRKTWGTFANEVVFPDGTKYDHDPSYDLTTTSERSLPLLFFLYGATRLKAEPGQADAFADQQILTGCLMSRVSPMKLASLSDADKLGVLCNSARALAWTLSVNEEYRGSSFSVPLAAESIGHFAGQCVEQAVLVATVLMHIRDGTSALCRALQSVLQDYRIGQMLMTYHVNVKAGVPKALQAQRHLVTALLPKAALATLDRDPALPGAKGAAAVDARRPVCLLDTVSSMPVSKFVPHLGQASSGEWRVMSGILPQEWDESAFLNPNQKIGMCTEIHLVDVDSDIRQMACVTRLQNNGPAVMGIPMYAFYSGNLSATVCRLWSPVRLSTASPEFAVCKTLFDETRRLSNVYQNTRDAEYLNAASSIYAQTEQAVLAVQRQVPSSKRMGWRIALYDYVPDETPYSLTTLLDRSVALANERAASNENGGLHISNMRAASVGRVLLCADVRATVVLVTYHVAGKKT